MDTPQDGPAPGPARPPSPVEPGKIGGIIADTGLLLAHAAETGAALDSDTVSAVETAREAYAADKWTADTAKIFWPAYSKLCATVKPVTVESIKASNAESLKKILRTYRIVSYALLLFILPISVFLFVDSGISNDIDDKVKVNNELAVNLRAHLDPPQQGGAGTGGTTGSLRTPEELLSGLQQFATTTRLLYSRASLLNAFVIRFEKDPYDRGDVKATEDARRTALEIPKDIAPERNALKQEFFEKLGTYQEIRAFAKNVQQANLVFFGALTAYVLPVAYAALGACAYALRTLSEQTAARTYQPSHHAFARVVIALIAGLVVGLFNNFTQGISLSPLAIAFVVGYAVEIFFSFLDAFLETLKKVRS